MPQGDAFFALCHEASGHMGDSAHDLLGMIIDSTGGSVSDRMTFMVYALKRLHAARVAAVINSRPSILTGPGVPPWCGLLPLGAARPKPVINFRSNGGIASHAITTATNSNFAVARLTSSTKGAGVLLSYCLGSPVHPRQRKKLDLDALCVAISEALAGAAVSSAA